jgi:hypothetical protein
MATTAEQGMLRTEVDYAWPAIFRSAYEVKLVYLDLNQWIGLAKAASAHKDGARYVQALEAARAAKDAGTAMFPFPAPTTWNLRASAASGTAPTSLASWKSSQTSRRSFRGLC